jgi:hypothetical protein
MSNTSEEEEDRQNAVKSDIVSSARRGRGLIILWRLRRDKMFAMPTIRGIDPNQIMMELFYFIQCVDAERQFVLYMFDAQHDGDSDANNGQMADTMVDMRTYIDTIPAQSSIEMDAPMTMSISKVDSEFDNGEYIKMAAKIEIDANMANDAKKLLQRLALVKAKGDVAKSIKVLYVCERMALSKWRESGIVASSASK